MIHFSECALSGYAGVDIPDCDAIDWTDLAVATHAIMQRAKELKLWVLLWLDTSVNRQQPSAQLGLRRQLTRADRQSLRQNGSVQEPMAANRRSTCSLSPGNLTRLPHQSHLRIADLL